MGGILYLMHRFLFHQNYKNCDKFQVALFVILTPSPSNYVASNWIQCCFCWRKRTKIMLRTNGSGLKGKRNYENIFRNQYFLCIYENLTGMYIYQMRFFSNNQKKRILWGRPDKLGLNCLFFCVASLLLMGDQPISIRLLPSSSYSMVLARPINTFGLILVALPYGSSTFTSSHFWPLDVCLKFTFWW